MKHRLTGKKILLTSSFLAVFILLALLLYIRTTPQPVPSNTATIATKPSAPISGELNKKNCRNGMGLGPIQGN